MPDPAVTASIKALQSLEKAAKGAVGPPVSTTELDSGELAPQTLDYLTRASGGPLGELWAIPGDWIRFRRWQRAIARADEARSILARRGRQPRQVEDSTLVPLIDAANLTDDETLAAKWAALLANATDPAIEPVQPVNAEILRQLSHDDALLLDHIVAVSRARRLPAGSLSLPVLQRSAPVDDPARFQLSIDNLLRLRVLVEIIEQDRRSTLFPSTQFDLSHGRLPKLKSSLRLSALGRQFVEAVSVEPESLSVEARDATPSPDD